MAWSLSLAVACALPIQIPAPEGTPEPQIWDRARKHGQVRISPKNE
jgi:hypothetical protein